MTGQVGARSCHVCGFAVGGSGKWANLISSGREKSCKNTMPGSLLIVYQFNIIVFIQLIKAGGVELLPVKNEHLVAYSEFVFHKTHRDPFDRYLIAAAYSEKKAIITKDEKFNFYADKIKIVW